VPLMSIQTQIWMYNSIGPLTKSLATSTERCDHRTIPDSVCTRRATQTTRRRTVRALEVGANADVFSPLTLPAGLCGQVYV